jgi:hypothetical protein
MFERDLLKMKVERYLNERIIELIFVYEHILMMVNLQEFVDD